MFSIDEIIDIHNELIEQFGGIKGIRDLNLLDSALKKPSASFDNQDLYPSLIEKAGVLVESIIKNHPFIDGNKRIGYFIFRAFLLSYHKDLQATEKEKYEFIVGIASNSISREKIIDWIKNHLIEIP